MATRTMNNVEIYLDTRTAEQWGEVTKVIPKGFVCVELGTGKTKIKVGDGVKTYAALPYVADELTKATIIAALGYTPLDEAKVGVANGVASLGENGQVPASQLPSYVSDVVEVDGIDKAPETGKTETIYIDTKTGKCYRWSGTMYAEISKGDLVTASDNNGYIKVNGTDVKVFEQVQADWAEDDTSAPGYIKNKPAIPQGAVIDAVFSETSENAVQNKVVTAEFKKKVDESDKLILNCSI